MKVAQSCLTLCNPMDCIVHWSGKSFLSTRDLPNPGLEPRAPTLQADSLSAEPQGKPKNTGVGSLSLTLRIFPTQELNWFLPHYRQILYQLSYQFSLSRVHFFATTWTAARQASLSITNSWSLLKLMSIELVMSSNHLILCCPLLLPPSIFPSIRVFLNDSVLHIKWPKYWLSASVLPMNIQD